MEPALRITAGCMAFRDNLDRFEQFATDVILERRFGKRAMLLRWLLYALSWLFRGGVQARLWLYRNRIRKARQLGVMVLSVGNLTVGGTGKTPVVEKLARQLQDGGRRVAILSRGYKSKKLPLIRRMRRRWFGKFKPRIVHDGRRLLLDSAWAGDEPYMLARSLGNVLVLVDRDRARTGRHVIREFNADLLILDDGMQYQDIQHRIDICLVDRQAPFGNEYLLPRGTLREPPSNLARASYILITKAIAGESSALIQRIREYNRTAPIIECAHGPRYLQNLYDADDRKPLEWLQEKYIGALSGIARPESFEGALSKLGPHLVITSRFADHHRFSDEELSEFIARAVRRDLDAIITTEKDAVRFPQKIAGVEKIEVPIYFLRVEIEIISGHEDWENLIRRLTERRPVRAPEPVYV
jgi:tetraacyldisaccharide 4'-kinase